MRFLLLGAAIVCLCGPAPAQKKKPEVQVLETRARRVAEGKIAVDGSVKITGGKPVKGLVIIFDFLSSEDQTLTSEQIQVAGDALDPGEESSFHAETMNPPGAVRYRLRAFNGAVQQLRIGNAGPFTIE